jgi:dipeptidyl-peptidase-4
MLQPNFLRMGRIVFLMGLILHTGNSFAQKKNFTEQQLLENKMPEIVRALPSIVSWDEDGTLILSKKEHRDSSFKHFIFDFKTRKEMPYQGAARTSGSAINTGGKSVLIKENDLYLRVGDKPEIRLTNDEAKEVNPTFSPDSNYVAYTKNNNLYAVNISTKKEIQFTFDGNDSLMNGYASWVYTEEILGRASRYRAFWWSPDSKNIAFFKTDDSPVPVFTITGSAGQHGFVE